MTIKRLFRGTKLCVKSKMIFLNFLKPLHSIKLFISSSLTTTISQYPQTFSFLINVSISADFPHAIRIASSLLLNKTKMAMKILVPLDFSDEARNALNFALNLNNTENQVKVIHVIEYPAGGAIDPIGMAISTPYSADFVALMQKSAEKRVKEFLAEIEGGDKVEYIIEMGNPYVAINEVIAKLKVDLVVMGTKGASGFKEFLIGSNAEKVVRTSDCPVITLTDESDPREIKNIVFPTHLFDHPDDLLTHVKQLQAMFDATIHVVHINTPNNFVRDVSSKKALNEMVAKAMLTKFTVNIYNDIYEDQGILTFAKETNADMIAMGTHGRKGLGHLISGSLAEDVVNHAKRPIWTYKARK